jgi:antitoxin ParD1/3/4
VNLGKLCQPDKLATMPTRNINLTHEQDAFVKEVIRSGDYQNASEAVRDALRVLRQRRREDALKLRLLRSQLRLGVDALRRGDADAVDEADLGEYLAALAAPRRAHRRAR